MKKIAITLIFLLISYSVFSQETALDKISKETCEYLSSVDLNSKEVQNELGLKIIKLFSKYEEELKKEGIVLDLSKGRQGGEEFGEKVGMNMVKFCPDALIALAGQKDFNEDENIESDKVTEGELISVKGEEINTVSLRDNNGKIQKFVWINNFEGSEKLINTDDVLGIKVKLTYNNIEIYSPKLKEYIVKKQIAKIEYLK